MRSKTSPSKASYENIWALIDEMRADRKAEKKAMQEARKKEEAERKKKEAERKKEEAERKLLIKQADKELKEFSKRMDEADKRAKEDRKKIDESIKAMHQELGGISNSNGDVAESYFINSFEKSMQFAGQRYDDIGHNVRQKSRKLNLQGEYDIVLYNCTSIAIIEIKYKAKKEDVEPLLKKAETFKALFPHYKDYELYLGLAGMHVNITAEREAIKQGIAVIKQVGDTMVVNDAHLKMF